MGLSSSADKDKEAQLSMSTPALPTVDVFYCIGICRGKFTSDMRGYWMESSDGECFIGIEFPTSDISRFLHNKLGILEEKKLNHLLSSDLVSHDERNCIVLRFVPSSTKTLDDIAGPSDQVLCDWGATPNRKGAVKNMSLDNLISLIDGFKDFPQSNCRHPFWAWSRARLLVLKQLLRCTRTVKSFPAHSSNRSYGNKTRQTAFSAMAVFFVFVTSDAPNSEHGRLATTYGCDFKAKDAEHLEKEEKMPNGVVRFQESKEYGSSLIGQDCHFFPKHWEEIVLRLKNPDHRKWRDLSVISGRKSKRVHFLVCWHNLLETAPLQFQNPPDWIKSAAGDFMQTSTLFVDFSQLIAFASACEQANMLGQTAFSDLSTSGLNIFMNPANLSKCVG